MIAEDMTGNRCSRSAEDTQYTLTILSIRLAGREAGLTHSGLFADRLSLHPYNAAYRGSQR